MKQPGVAGLHDAPDGVPLVRMQDEAMGEPWKLQVTVADEERHEIDRGAIQRALQGAADVQLEGRIVPVVRNRAEGISRCTSLSGKVRAWAAVTGAKDEPLLACLERLSHQDPEQIAGEVLSRVPAHAPEGGGSVQAVAAAPAGGAMERSAALEGAVELELF